MATARGFESGCWFSVGVFWTRRKRAINLNGNSPTIRMCVLAGSYSRASSSRNSGMGILDRCGSWVKKNGFERGLVSSMSSDRSGQLAER
ncbi:MAG TPA: hypothetical protein IGS17_13155 [Oscillatoriales cyanobacterium M59_W2019_021]|nr:hypothetical protein [Oscillatoriales cyanobacterium M59_W2019_021]